MGIELPPELADVAAQAGVAWPEADEEAMAAQAQAWRDTAKSMAILATDADTTARAALSAVSGDAAEAASTEWKSFVEPDSGHLTSVVRDCNAAADRLEHAANQVGAAKVEIVRNLVSLAQNQDAATAAAQAGHPFALAGLDTAVKGTAANVANIESQLVNAVQPTSGVDVATVQNPVNANPGHHLQPGTTTNAVTHTVTDTAQTATSLTSGTVQHGTQLPGDLVRHGAGAVGDTADHVIPGSGMGDLARQGGGAVGDTADQVLPGGSGPGDLLPGQPGAPLPNGTGSQVGGVLPGQPGDLLPGRPDGVLPGRPGDLLPGPPGDVVPGQPGGPLPDGPGAGPGRPDLGLPGDPGEVTGPVPADSFPGDAPTPPTGQTVQAGFAGGLEAPAAGSPNLPPAAAVPQSANPAAPAPSFGGAAPFAGPPPAGAGGGAPSAPAPGAAPVAQPAPARPTAFAPAATPVPVAADRPQDPAVPRKHLVGPPGAPPPAKGERNEVLAAFWIHMFPIGHLPVASYRPARQLPPPPEELDYAAGLRFEPGDHPRFDLIDSTARLTEITTALARREAAKAAPNYQHFAPPTGTGHPPAPPADAIAAGYPPAAPAGRPSEAGGTGYPPVPAARPGEGTGFPPAAAAAARPDGAVATGSPPVTGQPNAGIGTGFPPAEAAGQPSEASAGYPPAQVDQPGEPGTVPSMRPVTPSAGFTADHPTVQALLEGHDPLGGSHEREWDRRYLVRLGSVTAHGISPEGLEYNWPTSEQYPEGGSASGEPEVLAEDTVIDRFGTPHGRVFAQGGTPFPQRSLPPAHKDTGYRRYRVTKPLPVWRAVSAAWFGQPGGGVRYRTTHSAAELVALGYLEEIA